ncbi:efflux RND transporter periplasmic adaptor subunit [Teredinibacter haidensis]|uniref:efflux RND transporter periplasmic adaptor subunit n=1 Tax=Teredinibacter haidensis TaxID=2731755 RepID=UPI00094916EE|nr:efflux RND transporter periplasmic adaptor subunit [Teredinibacter haidensis]
MNKSHSIKPVTLFAAVGGLIVGAALTLLLSNGGQRGGERASVDKKPLYWVAPMDPNYRRDKPGLSPMGMDLIPVYDEGSNANDAGPGTIYISPDVINNLGVRTGLAVRKPLHTEIVTVGYVQYDENKLIHIHPRVSGWVEKLFVKAAGDPVEKGTPLYSLYSPELVNAQEELVLAVNRKNSRLIQASENRLKALQISGKFVQELKRTLKIQQTIDFYAPQSGVVDNLNIREGFFVQPGTTMFSIGALDKVWIEAEIFERQASLVKVSDPVTMTLDYLPGRAWNGKVEYIYPTLDSKTRTVRIRLSFENTQRELKPNMFAQISVHTNSEEQLLVIPREALIRTGSQDRVVLALGDGSFKSVAVKVGRSDQTVAEIIDGLKEGEKVVTSAQFLLDSESSKNSDFKRMHHADDQPASVWVEGEIKSVMVDNRMVTASHEEIADWDWPSMTMNFSVNSNVEFETLTSGTTLHMEISKLDNGSYEISGVHILSQGVAEGELDHARRDQKEMNHAEMDHSQMDHSNHGSHQGEE